MLNDVVIEDVSSEVGDSSRVDDSTIKWVEIAFALECRIKEGLIVNVKHLNYDEFKNDAGALFEREMKEVLMQLNSIKVNTELAAQYAKVIDGVEKEEIFQFNTKNYNIFQTPDLSEKFKNIRVCIDQQMSEFQEIGSGWSRKRILHLHSTSINALL